MSVYVQLKKNQKDKGEIQTWALLGTSNFISQSMGFEARSDIYSEIKTEHMDEDWGIIQFIFSYFSYSWELGMLLLFLFVYVCV